MVSGGIARRWALAGVVFGAPLLFTRVASANVQFVMDGVPASFFTGVLTNGDFPESATSFDEVCRLQGHVINGTSVAERFLVRLRVDGTSEPWSEVVFQIPPNSDTPYDYRMTIPGPRPPFTVGVEVQSPDGPMTFGGGLFTAAPLPPPGVPSLGPLGATALGAALGLLGVALSRRRLVAH
jgi:hypothetical protein